MIVSVNWLKKFTPIDGSVEELVDLIGSRLVEIEEVVDLGLKYQDVIIAKVVDCMKVEGSDHLSVTKIDDGGVREDVQRDDDGLIQVVCGAPNVREGLLVAWLPPKSTVPASYDDAEPFVLDSRKLMGMMSHGMLASASELDLFDDHSGILEVDADVAPGTSFAEVYELNDYLLDIENKSLTHRPDCFGIIGFAREVSAIQGKHFTTPDWLATLGGVIPGKATAPTPQVRIDDVALSARYQAVVLDGLNTQTSSPLAIQTYLARVGMRPVNAVVDVTNYLMLLTGQPLHAFDYDKLKAVTESDDITMVVRAGHENETLELLDGRTIELTPEDIVIAANDTAVALAGAMGGARTEVDENTTAILLESATFDLFHLRTTQMRHGIFSEAITRFTKGQSPEQTHPVLCTAVHLLRDWAGVQAHGHIAESYPTPHLQPTISINAGYVNDVLGTDDSVMQMRATLENVEFDVHVESGDVLVVRPPYWRHDIAIPEDIVEEIGRINSYDDIEPTLAQRDFRAVRSSQFDDMRAAIRATLMRSGANELLTYSFVHGDLLEKALQKPSSSYRIINSISPDLQYYRQSITPSLLQHVYSNIRAGYDEFALFELNKVHNKTVDLTDEDVPTEEHRLAFVITNKSKTDGSAYYRAKKYLSYLIESLGVTLSVAPFDDEPTDPMMTPYEWRRSARIVAVDSDVTIGIVGEYKKAVGRAFKLPEATAGFEIDTERLYELYKNRQFTYTPISKYPGTTRDVCFQVAYDLPFDAIIESITSELMAADTYQAIEPVDIYQADDSDVKNCTVRLYFQSYDRTLEGGEVNDLVVTASEKVCQQLSAKIV